MVVSTGSKPKMVLCSTSETRFSASASSVVDFGSKNIVNRQYSCDAATQAVFSGTAIRPAVSSIQSASVAAFTGTKSGRAAAIVSAYSTLSFHGGYEYGPIQSEFFGVDAVFVVSTPKSVFVTSP